MALDQFDTHAQHGYLRHCRLARELSGHWFTIGTASAIGIAIGIEGKLPIRALALPPARTHTAYVLPLG